MHQDDYWGIHEWNPTTASYVGHYDVGLSPRSKYHFYITMALCVAGREIFALNVSHFTSFAFNMDSKTTRAIHLDEFPALTRGSTCVGYEDQVLVLSDTGELWRIDPKNATCRRVAAQGAFGARPVNGMYGRARTWNDKLVVVPTTYENVRVLRLT
jgi:hypothetical protein